jgi:multidrug efflux pump subunit AcrA (membrane-fusion protein)
MNPTDLLAGRHKAYRQARDRYLRATAAREQAQQRVNELERELATTEARDRVDLGEALVDKRKPPAAQADAARATLQAAKRDMEALQYAEQRAARKLDTLPRENKEAWLGRAERDLRSTRDDYRDAIGQLDQAREQLVNEATLVSYLANDGIYSQPLIHALQRPGAHGTVEPIPVGTVLELMLAEAAGVEDMARLDPNRPMPEPQFHLAQGGGSKRIGWG